MRKELVQNVRGGALGAALLVLCGSAGTAQEAVVVGGLTPSVRPAGLPSIQGIHNGIEWYRKALTGVSQPYPASLVWLDRQGEWYTPFTRPGMPGYYDIRGWHGPR
ncbi:MAG TPA: hypothetical protein PLQ11_08890 [Beijerinckiaceae bacterium]|nr:hypothetical protein [Beijerinckiaceae bacterium]